MDKSLEALHFGRTMSVKEKSPHSSFVYVSVFHLLQTQLHRHKSRLFKWDRIRTRISSGNRSSLPFCVRNLLSARMQIGSLNLKKNVILEIKFLEIGFLNFFDYVLKSSSTRVILHIIITKR